jgi:hypothetical protein
MKSQVFILPAGQKCEITRVNEAVSKVLNERLRA